MTLDGNRGISWGTGGGAIDVAAVDDAHVLGHHHWLFDVRESSPPRGGPV